ncbi:MAG: RNase adapter RapZ [Clostridiales bacterium]|nr:RNase adapter RapZ [Clostridiales bacterium]
MDVIILTGMSGAGKSHAANILEDQGYFCIDNLPPQVVPELIRTFLKGQGGEGFAINKLAFVVDVRSSDYLKGFGKALNEIKNIGCPYRILFLDANDQVLVSRYRQTRRKHPLSAGLSLTEAIEKERSLLRGIRARATHVIDTSFLAKGALREELLNIIEVEDVSSMDIHIESFGFKYGIPADCDISCDVRFLPNPFYSPELKMHSGADQEIIDYLESYPDTEQYFE